MRQPKITTMKDVIEQLSKCHILALKILNMKVLPKERALYIFIEHGYINIHAHKYRVQLHQKGSYIDDVIAYGCVGASFRDKHDEGNFELIPVDSLFNLLQKELDRLKTIKCDKKNELL